MQGNSPAGFAPLSHALSCQFVEPGCLPVRRGGGSLQEVDAQWVRTEISPFKSPSTGFCAFMAERDRVQLRESLATVRIAEED